MDGLCGTCFWNKVYSGKKEDMWTREYLYNVLHMKVRWLGKEITGKLP